MSISSETIRNDYVGNGVLDTYPFEFIIYDQDDIDVYVDGVVQVVDVNFTIVSTDIEKDNGGNIVFGVGHIPADEAKIALLSGAPYIQGTDFASRDETYEETYDKNVILIKQLREVITRCLQFAVSSTTNSITLPEPVAARHLRWAADLLSLENIFVPTFPGPVAGYYLKWADDLSGLENVRPEPIEYLPSPINLSDVDITIASGVITVLDGPAHYIVDTEGAAATDDLDKILGLAAGDLFTLSPKNSARTVVIKNGAFFQTAGGLNCLLTDVEYETLFRMLSGGVARELSRSANA